MRMRMDLVFESGDTDSFNYHDREQALQAAGFASDCPFVARIEVIRVGFPAKLIALWRNGVLIALSPAVNRPNPNA